MIIAFPIAHIRRVASPVTVYSHDGLRDSLTNLAAPPLFYEELRREIAKKSRSGEGVQVLRIVLSKIEASDVGGPEEPDSELTGDIVEFAQILSSSSRGEDVCARMGQNEFLVLFSGGMLVISTFISRLVSQWYESERLHFLASSSLLVGTKETGLDFLNRLDLETLVEHSL